MKILENNFEMFSLLVPKRCDATLRYHRACNAMATIITGQYLQTTSVLDSWTVCSFTRSLVLLFVALSSERSFYPFHAVENVFSSGILRSRQIHTYIFPIVYISILSSLIRIFLFEFASRTASSAQFHPFSRWIICFMKSLLNYCGHLNDTVDRDQSMQIFWNINIFFLFSPHLKIGILAGQIIDKNVACKFHTGKV